MKKQNDYFAMMEELVNYSAKAADLLCESLRDFSPEKLPEQRASMHQIEHEADDSRHETLRKLSQEFITPIERDDILGLVQIIDDVTDAIDEVMINLYVFHMRALPPAATALAELVRRCVKALALAVAEFRHFKKSEKLRELLIEVNTVESEADGVYIEAMHDLFGSDVDALAMMGGRQIYEGLESCCDLCEHAADVIEDTVFKNT